MTDTWPAGAQVETRPAPIWVLADPRAGTAAQALGIAERLGQPFRTVTLEWSPLARLPWPLPTLAGLTPRAREALGTEVPALVLSAGRRSAPVALWLRRRGARVVHCMRPGFAAGQFDRLVLGRHDLPAKSGWPSNVVPVLGATHRISPERLLRERAAHEALSALPGPRTVLLLGGPVRGEGMVPAEAAAIAGRLAAEARASGGSVLASTSRRTGDAAAAAVAAALGNTPGRLFRWGEAGPNPFAGFLAWADRIVVTGDSVSMISEALATTAPVFVARAGGARRHARLHRTLFEAGQARPFDGDLSPFDRAPLDESARVAALLVQAGLVPTGAAAG
ncbi:mitochondrial fission ELM1 family protein [Roseomonas elaeocarpi]|uniref:Mitochondrial fission ELM1 family protein n=1 Tax=Roseomonas elaeocarpi TaxID=907779 RepID=A0ABV6JR65_9PROT